MLHSIITNEIMCTMYRRTFLNGYFHIYGRGNYKQDVFLSEKDYARFLFLVVYHQSPTSFTNVTRRVSHYVQHRMFNISEDEVREISDKRHVELINFALMPNHFHLTVFEKEDGGISRYMQRILNGYTKYHNTKYEKSGHLFQGPFKARHIEDDNYLSYLSAYIHKNPTEIAGWKNKEHVYPWSSFQDYVADNRWGKLLNHEIVTQKFTDGEEYKEFVNTSGAKMEKLILIP